MKIKDVPELRLLAARRPNGLPQHKVVPGGANARLLEHLLSHPDEVVDGRDCPGLAVAFGVQARSVQGGLAWLAREGFLAKAMLDGRPWYGSHEAIGAFLAASDAEGRDAELVLP